VKGLYIVSAWRIQYVKGKALHSWDGKQIILSCGTAAAFAIHAVSTAKTTGWRASGDRTFCGSMISRPCCTGQEQWVTENIVRNQYQPRLEKM